MTDRRACVARVATVGWSLACAPWASLAQKPGAVARIGILSFGSAPAGTDPDPDKGLRQGLHELGYVEGRNIFIERRFALGRPERLAELAAEMVQLKVDVILAGGPAPREAARQATRTIPIVTISGSDPVREGWARSLAQPGGNVTGLTVTFPELNAKCLELLGLAVPGLARVAVLMAPAEVVDPKVAVTGLEAGAEQLGLKLQVLEVAGPNDFDAAFKRARQWQAQALLAWTTNTVVAHRSRLATQATADRLPAIGTFPLLAQAGFLMAYGPDLDDLLRRAIGYVDKVLKGARPGELAIERPTKFQFLVNRKAAKAIGLTLQPSLLLRADEVIG